jgi:cytochrome c oxidase subunit 2
MLAEFWKLIGGDQARLFPEAASTFAIHDDHIMAYMLGISVIFTAGILIALLLFIVKYRHRPGNEIAHEVKMSFALEAAWTIVPFALVFIAFFWGAHNYIDMLTPRRQAENIYVVAKQWMWKFEHENGVSEINQLHVPIGRDINLIMISQDVIHSFFIPDFRVKYDVLPGRYTRTWFKAQKVGSYYLLCTQYCGVDHSSMIGNVIAQPEADYHAWLEASRAILAYGDQPEIRGKNLYATKGCASCHDSKEQGGQGVAPALAGRFFNGDEDHIRQSILNPSSKISPGYPDAMPTYAGVLKEAEILDLIAFLKASKRKEASND